MISAYIHVGSVLFTLRRVISALWVNSDGTWRQHMSRWHCNVGFVLLHVEEDLLNC